MRKGKFCRKWRQENIQSGRTSVCLQESGPLLHTRDDSSPPSTLPGGYLGSAALGREQYDRMFKIHKLKILGTAEILQSHPFTR
jgi:hypothetical protein